MKKSDLKDNDKFGLMIREIEEFNKDVIKFQTQNQDIPKVTWKVEFYRTLRNMLNEVAFTIDKKVRNDYVDKFYDWYVEKLTKSSETASTRP